MKKTQFNWVKRGFIYAPSGAHGFDYSHCHKPTPLLIDETTIRVYFGARTEKNITRTTFIDVDAANPARIKYIHPHPVVDLGKIGAFDDCGVNVTSIVRDGERIYMYVIGCNTSTTVHMRNAIGVAVSTDGGTTFTRLYDGAVFDRTKDEPYYTGAVEVIKEGSLWRMWYTSGTEWKVVNGKPEIWYHIKYAESADGIDWTRKNISSIPPRHDHEATARPCVLKIGDGYHMWYSRRDLVAFRTDPKQGYRGGYADSADGIHWDRRDDLFGVEPSAQGWDSDTIAYPYCIRLGDRMLMFYNGNGFGKTGFGYAECRIDS